MFKKFSSATLFARKASSALQAPQKRHFAGYSDIKLPAFPIYKIVLTGGPCGGKSQALPHLRKGLNLFFYDQANN